MSDHRLIIIWVINVRSSPDHHEIFIFLKHGNMECGRVLFVPPDLSGFGSFCWKISLFFPTWWNKYYFTWKDLYREFYMFIVVCNKNSWKICLLLLFTVVFWAFYVYCCLCAEMLRNIQDPQNQTYKICSTKTG